MTLKIAYSAMWGVGTVPFKRAATEFGFDTSKFTFLKDSCVPDPDFGGNPCPNPEELHNMLILASNCNNIDLLIVNDPDADRFAMAEYDI